MANSPKMITIYFIFLLDNFVSEATGSLLVNPEILKTKAMKLLKLKVNN